MTHHRILDPAGMPVEVTDHAIDRFLDRVDGRCSAAEAALRIAACGRGIRAAASIGARVVRMPTGHRLVLADREPRVVTVLARGMMPDFAERAFPSLRLPEA